MRNEDIEYFEEEEFKQLLQRYENAKEEDQPIYLDADEFTDIAEYYMLRQREQDANECILLATSLHPDSIDPFVFLARQQMFHNNIKEAKRIAQSIKEQEDREVQFLWAEIAIKEGKKELANQQLANYYAQQTDELDYFLYDTATIFIDYEEWNLALAWAERLKREFPTFAKTDLLICEIKLGCGRIDEVIPALEAILSADPFNKIAWEYLAEAQSAKEEYNMAIESIEYLLAIDEKNLQGKVIRANCLFHLDRPEEAHEQYLDYLDIQPNDGVIRYYDSIVLMSLERWKEAHDQLFLAMHSLDPQSLEYEQAFLQMGFILSKTQNADEALRLIDEHYLSMGGEPVPEYYFLKGRILLDNKRKQEADVMFDIATRKSDDILKIRLMVAIEYIENELYDDAIEELKLLIESPVKEAEIECYPYLAYALYYKGGGKEYQECLHRAAQYNPRLTEYLFSPIYPNVPVSQYGQL